MLVTSRGVTKERIGFFRMDIVPPFDFDSDTIPSTPGIYAIVNRLNQHIYVGSAKNLLHRKQHHFRDLKAGKHKNPYLQRAYDSYGPDALLFGVIEHVSHVEDLLVREQYYIDMLNPQYNIARTAGSNLGMTVTPETKARMSTARLKHPHMLEQMEKLGADRRGKPLSPEHRAKITANQIGRKHSPASIEKMRAAKLGKKKTPEHAANIRAAKLGIPRSPETIAKVSAAKRGKKLSPEHRAKIGAAQIGRKHSPASIEKMRAAKLGKKNSPEARAKMSVSRKGKVGHKQSPETIEKRIATRKANREKRKAEQQANQPRLF